MGELAFHHVGISVLSLDEAIEWYGHVLAYAVEKPFVIDAANPRAAMLRNGELRIELFEVDGAASLPKERHHPPSDLRTHANKQAAFRTRDLNAFLVRMQTKGADIAFVVREAFGRGCFLHDCAGNLIGFVEQDN